MHHGTAHVSSHSFIVPLFIDGGWNYSKNRQSVSIAIEVILRCTTRKRRKRVYDENQSPFLTLTQTAEVGHVQKPSRNTEK